MFMQFINLEDCFPEFLINLSHHYRTFSGLYITRYFTVTYLFLLVNRFARPKWLKRCQDVSHWTSDATKTSVDIDPLPRMLSEQFISKFGR